jgi:phosphatidylinositol alpha-1,6-mannosyltransferase
MQDAGQEINLGGVTGYNVDLEREGELARRTIELLSNKALARQFSENGREHWRANFCFSAFRRRMEPIMAEFLAA